MSRLVLSESKIHPSVVPEIGGAGEYRHTVSEVEQAISSHKVVIVGMAQNPVVKKARQCLDNLSVEYHYLEYGNYFSQWKRRGAIKMWAGWQTFPMVFVAGQFVGGFSDLENLLETVNLPLYRNRCLWHMFMK